MCVVYKTETRYGHRNARAVPRGHKAIYQHVSHVMHTMVPINLHHHHTHLIHPHHRVQDILDGKSKADTVLCHTPDFLILPDMKWDPNSPVSSLYLLAIISNPTICLLHDLRGGLGGHMGMLEEIQERAYQVLMDWWDLPRGVLRMYMHYQPSYFVWFCSFAFAG